MRKSKFSENQIIAILKAVEAGRTVREVCREHEVSEATYYQWKSKYGGMQAAKILLIRNVLIDSDPKPRRQRRRLSITRRFPNPSTRHLQRCGLHGSPQEQPNVNRWRRVYSQS
jgi:putative transposase